MRTGGLVAATRMGTEDDLERWTDEALVKTNQQSNEKCHTAGDHGSCERTGDGTENAEPIGDFEPVLLKFSIGRRDSVVACDHD